MNLKYRNVSKEKDAYYDQFPVCLHISDNGFIRTEEGVVKRNIAKEYGLRVISCRYGGNASHDGLHPSIIALSELLQETYGDVEEGEYIGFYLALECEQEGETFVYFLATGNNGQEISTGLYLSTSDLLGDPSFRETVRQIDRDIFSLLQKADVQVF